MIRLSVFLILVAVFGDTYAKDIGYFNNANGGKTIITDNKCRQSSDMYEGYSTGKDRTVLSFCWVEWNGKLMMVFPSNQSTHFVPLNEIRKMNEPSKILYL